MPVGRDVELNDDELGFIASDGPHPVELALLQQRTLAQLQQLFYTY